MEIEDPFARFGRVFADALALDPALSPEPTAMSVATVDAGGQPSVRIVLLKGFDSAGFVFYTNYEGRKGRELLGHPLTALCFHWPHIEVQVRVEGAAVPVTSAEADAYFATRARASQLGAWASRQSHPIEHEGDLELRLAEFEEKFAGREVSRPHCWSGFRVVPEKIEFWHNRPSRLHLRHLYIRSTDGWKMQTLFP